MSRYTRLGSEKKLVPSIATGQRQLTSEPDNRIGKIKDIRVRLLMELCNLNGIMIVVEAAGVDLPSRCGSRALNLLRAPWESGLLAPVSKVQQRSCCIT